MARRKTTNSEPPKRRGRKPKVTQVKESNPTPDEVVAPVAEAKDEVQPEPEIETPTVEPEVVKEEPTVEAPKEKPPVKIIRAVDKRLLKCRACRYKWFSVKPLEVESCPSCNHAGIESC
jgi:hypothetical protein